MHLRIRPETVQGGAGAPGMETGVNPDLIPRDQGRGPEGSTRGATGAGSPGPGDQSLGPAGINPAQRHTRPASPMGLGPESARKSPDTLASIY